MARFITHASPMVGGVCVLDTSVTPSELFLHIPAAGSSLLFGGDHGKEKLQQRAQWICDVLNREVETEQAYKLVKKEIEAPPKQPRKVSDHQKRKEQERRNRKR